MSESQLNDADEFFDRMLEALSITDLKTLIAEREDIAILPLFLYDHSVQSISTASFIGRAQHAEWDSGQVGYLHKGDMVTISGDLALTEYSDRNGQPRCSLEVDVSDVAFPPAPKAPPTVQAPADSDELPI